MDFACVRVSAAWLSEQFWGQLTTSVVLAYRIKIQTLDAIQGGAAIAELEILTHAFVQTTHKLSESSFGVE